MKKLVSVQEVEGEGFTALLGEQVEIWCVNYIYTGTLVGVNEECVLLDNPYLVYETGAFDDKKWKDAQPLGGSRYIQKSAIESFAKTKKVA